MTADPRLIPALPPKEFIAAHDAWIERILRLFPKVDVSVLTIGESSIRLIRSPFLQPGTAVAVGPRSAAMLKNIEADAAIAERPNRDETRKAGEVECVSVCYAMPESRLAQSWRLIATRWGVSGQCLGKERPMSDNVTPAMELRTRIQSPCYAVSRSLVEDVLARLDAAEAQRDSSLKSKTAAERGEGVGWARRYVKGS